MSLTDDITEQVKKILREQWKIRDGTVVPEVEDLILGNEAVKLNGTILYADLADSTKMVDIQTPQFSAEVYKTYLHCASAIIKNEGGVITAYDGDRVMAVFIDGAKNTDAVRAALRINYAVTKIINPALKAQYPHRDFQIRHVVGVDTSILHVARTDVWGANDLVWVGRAANYAAKLCNIDDAGYPTFITGDVYDSMLDEAKTTNGQNMWEQRSWTAMNNMTIYRSNWHWGIG